MTYQRRPLGMDGSELAKTIYGAGGPRKKGQTTMALRVSPEFLRALAEADAPESVAGERWDPQPGEFIAGELSGVREVDTENGTATVITVNDHKLGPVDLFMGAVLRQIWEKKKPREGEIIGIKFLGEQESQSGRKYKNYRVMLSREGAKPAAAAVNPEDPFADE